MRTKKKTAPPVGGGMPEVPEPDLAFAERVGPWFRWFAWRPVRTSDRGWRWLRMTWRCQTQSLDYLDGPICTAFYTVVDREG